MKRKTCQLLVLLGLLCFLFPKEFAPRVSTRQMFNHISKMLHIKHYQNIRVKQYKKRLLPKSTVEHGYMCPHGLTGLPAVTLTKQLKYKKRLILKCIHHFNSDLIHDMDHRRISGNEPSSVILSQTKWFQKLKIITRKC